MAKPNLEIRQYLESDEAAVTALWNMAFADPTWWNDPSTIIAKKLAIQRDLFLVAELGEELVGTVLGGYDGHRGWVYHLAVAPQHRRYGYARRLMTELETRLAEHGCTKLNLQVRAENRGVVDFYLEGGYAVEDRISMGKLI